jgi:hypothetical protein
VLRIDGGAAHGARANDYRQAMATEWQLDDPTALPRIGEFFAGAPLGAATFGWTSGVVAGLGPATVRLTATQVAFRRRIGFAWLWLPGTWLAHPQAELVLSLGLRQRLTSPRWKQVVEPYPGRWTHHLEVRDPAELDEEVAGWVAEAYDAAD